MAIIINFNMCDNSPECSGMAVCPTDAISWNDNVSDVLGNPGTLQVDNDKCVSCGLCISEEGCPIGAIKLVDTDVPLEEQNYTKESVAALFVERYGAEPITEEICISEFDISQNENGVYLVEEFCGDSIQCLLHSIPVKTILDSLKDIMVDKQLTYYKKECIAVDNTEYPRLSIYCDGELKGVINGYYDDTQLDSFISAIRSLL